MNLPDDIRPPVVLYKTVEYMRECLADLDRLVDEEIPYSKKNRPTFIEIYSLIRDRSKSISQDIGIINQPENKFHIMVTKHESYYYSVLKSSPDTWSASYTMYWVSRTSKWSSM